MEKFNKEAGGFYTGDSGTYKPQGQAPVEMSLMQKARVDPGEVRQMMDQIESGANPTLHQLAGLWVPASVMSRFGKDDYVQGVAEAKKLVANHISRLSGIKTTYSIPDTIIAPTGEPAMTAAQIVPILDHLSRLVTRLENSMLPPRPVALQSRIDKGQAMINALTGILGILQGTPSSHGTPGTPGLEDLRRRYQESERSFGLFGNFVPRIQGRKEKYIRLSGEVWAKNPSLESTFYNLAMGADGRARKLREYLLNF